MNTKPSLENDVINSYEWRLHHNNHNNEDKNGN